MLALIFCLLLGADMACEDTTLGTTLVPMGMQVLVGDGTRQLGSVWQPWPQPDLWDIVRDDGFAESVGLSRYYWGRPVASPGEARITYSTKDLRRFRLEGDELGLRWKPAINDGDPNLYQSIGLHDTEDGDNQTELLAEILVGDGDVSGEVTRLPDAEGLSDTLSEGQSAVAWHPDGEYVALGTGITDANLRLYKRVGDTIEKVEQSPAVEDPGEDNTIVQEIAWHPSGTFLAVAHGADQTDLHTLTLYEFDELNETLTLMPLPEQPTEGTTNDSAFTLVWAGDYLFVGVDDWTAPTEEIAIYQWDSIAEALYLVDRIAILNDTVQSLAFDPSGTYLAVGLFWGSTFFRWYEWDPDAETLTELAQPDTPPTRRIYTVAWDPTGEYLLIGGERSAGLGISGLHLYKRVGTTLTKLGDQGFYHRVQWISWHPTLPFALVGVFDSGLVGDQPIITLWQRDGDSIAEVSGAVDEQPSTRDGASANGFGWHEDGDLIVVAGTPGIGAGLPPVVWLYEFTGAGGGSGLTLRLTAEGWTYPFDEGDHAGPETWETPYDEDEHAWIRFRHVVATNMLMIDTAGRACAGWVNRLALELAEGTDLSKMFVGVDAWVVTASGDAEEPSVGFYGPFNPAMQEHALSILQRVLPLPKVLGFSKVLPMTITVPEEEV